MIIIGLVLLIGWLIKFFKARKDLFYRIQKERVTLCKMNNRYGKSGKHWFKIHKNIPIRLFKNNEKGIPVVSEPIGYYRGDAEGSEGNKYLAFSSNLYKQFFILPKINLLIINDLAVKKVRIKDEKTGLVFEKELKNIPMSKNIIQFNEREIFIYAESLCNCGMFFVPVIKTVDGKIIDLVPVTMSDMENVAMAELFQGGITNWANLNKEGANLNPTANFQNKVGDTSASIDRPIVTSNY